MNLYVVRNKEGKYFRAVGYGGGGDSWVDTLEKAKFYARIGQAKSRVTYFFKNWPAYGCPEILEFSLDVTQAKVMNMEEASKKSVSNIAKRKLQREQAYNKHLLSDLLRKEEEIKQRIKKLS